MNYEERKERWNQNKEELRDWIQNLDSSFYDLEREIQDRLRLIIGRSGSRNESSSVNDRLRIEFIEKKILNKLEIFEKFEIGKIGMKNFIKSQLMRKNPNDYIWINFDEESGNYELISRGKEIPENYDGWIPSEMKNL